jgi:hypothetical protein
VSGEVDGEGRALLGIFQIWQSKPFLPLRLGLFDKKMLKTATENL